MFFYRSIIFGSKFLPQLRGCTSAFSYIQQADHYDDQNHQDGGRNYFRIPQIQIHRTLPASGMSTTGSLGESPLWHQNRGSRQYLALIVRGLITIDRSRIFSPITATSIATPAKVSDCAQHYRSK